MSAPPRPARRVEVAGVGEILASLADDGVGVHLDGTGYLIFEGLHEDVSERALFAVETLRGRERSVREALALARGERVDEKPMCKRGHLFDESNTATRRDGARVCVACKRLRATKSKAAGA